jgi:hypothetical protein
VKTFRIEHPHNEASALLGLQRGGLSRELGWDVGFWIVSDERDGAASVAALGRGDGEWQVLPLRARGGGQGAGKRTEDAETLARAGSWVYAFGSQFGAKEGPLEPSRHFVARFNEALVVLRGGRLTAEVEVARRPFLLHRLVNDAVRAAGLELLEPNPEVRRGFVHPPRKKGEKKGKRWAALVREEDVPVNVEGATFLPGGHLVLGLRYPVTAGGHPILVEIAGIDRYFDRPRAPPDVVGVHVLESAGRRTAPAGVRELDCLGGELHVVTGNLDSRPEESLLVGGVEGAERAPGEHWAVPVAQLLTGERALTGELVRRFDASAAVEGIALVGGDVWYAHDDAVIRLEVDERQIGA